MRHAARERTEKDRRHLSDAFEEPFVRLPPHRRGLVAIQIAQAANCGDLVHETRQALSTRGSEPRVGFTTVRCIACGVSRTARLITRFDGCWSEEAVHHRESMLLALQE